MMRRSQSIAAKSVVATILMSGSLVAHAATQSVSLNMTATQGGGRASATLTVPPGATAIRAVATDSQFALQLTGTGATCMGTGSTASCTLNSSTSLSLRATNNRACFLGVLCGDETSAVGLTWTLPDAPQVPDAAARLAALEAEVTALRAALQSGVAANQALKGEVDALKHPGESRVIAAGTVVGPSSVAEGGIQLFGRSGTFQITWETTISNGNPLKAYRIHVPNRSLANATLVLASGHPFHRNCLWWHEFNGTVRADDMFITCQNIENLKVVEVPPDVDFAIFDDKP